MNKKCITPNGLHNFEPRYDYKEPNSESIVALIQSKCNESVAFRTLETLKEKIYIKDICLNCGIEVKRSEQDNKK